MPDPTIPGPFEGATAYKSAADFERALLDLYGPNPRRFLRPAMEEVAPELLARFQAEFAQAMANATEHKVWCPVCGEYVPMSALDEHECDEAELAGHQFTGMLAVVDECQSRAPRTAEDVVERLWRRVR